MLESCGEASNNSMTQSIYSFFSFTTLKMSIIFQVNDLLDDIHLSVFFILKQFNELSNLFEMLVRKLQFFKRKVNFRYSILFFSLQLIEGIFQRKTIENVLLKCVQ